MASTLSLGTKQRRSQAVDSHKTQNAPQKHSAARFRPLSPIVRFYVPPIQDTDLCKSVCEALSVAEVDEMKAAKEALVQATALASEAAMLTIMSSPSEKVTKALRKERLQQCIAKIEKDSAVLGVKMRTKIHASWELCRNTSCLHSLWKNG